MNFYIEVLSKINDKIPAERFRIISFKAPDGSMIEGRQTNEARREGCFYSVWKHYE